jgi:hypothetical protein
MAIGQGLGLISTAGLGVFRAANSEVELVAPVNAVLNSTANSYIFTTGIMKRARQTNFISAIILKRTSSHLERVPTRSFYEHPHRHEEVHGR